MSFTTNQIGLKDSYGYIWMNTANWTGTAFSFTASYQELAGLSTTYTLASPSQDFAMTTDGRLKYTGVITKSFYIDAQYATQAGNYAIQLYKNGSPLSGSESYMSGPLRCLLSRFPVTLSTNDYLSLYGKRSSSGIRAIYQISLSATFAGGQ